MSRDWTPEELQSVSAAMKAAGYMSYEEFCEALASAAKTAASAGYVSYEEFCEQLPRMVVVENAPAGPGNELQPPSLPVDG